ncbi:MAG: thermonuclease family protein, partial [Ghiorsea sp.]
AYAAEYGTYQADVKSVYDGDTFKADIKVFPSLTQKMSVRILGIDTPEIKGKCEQEKEKAIQARDALVGFLGDKATLSKVQLGKFAGRVLAKVSVDGEDVAAYMLRAGHAIRYDGGKRQGWCE